MPRFPSRDDAPRVPMLDRLRGLAVLLMLGYHFCFDLDQYGWIRQAFNSDPVWLGLRALIISLFMAALGASTVLAHAEGIDWRALGRREVRLAAACLLVTAGSWWMFPASFIWFGILHFAWVASLLALPLRGLGWPLVPLAVLIVWAGNWVSATVFDHPWLGWIGCMTHKPITEDYVPLLPWFAAVLIGLYLGPFLKPATPAPGRLDRGLRWVGSHTLAIYLLHQPVLFGLLEALRAAGVTPRTP